MNGIDFFKSCSTNVRAVEDIFDLHYMILMPVRGWSGDLEIMQTLADLRARSILSTASNGELWVFATLENTPEIESDLESYGLTSNTEMWTSLEDEMKAETDGDVETLLLRAIEDFIAYRLAKDQNILHSGQFAWVYLGYLEDEPDPASKSVMMDLDAQLTENGLLYLSTRISPIGLHRMTTKDSLAGNEVLLAPTGQSAKVVAGTTSAAPVWRSRVAQALLAEGTAIDANGDWVTVELLESTNQPKFAWPRSLCLMYHELSHATGDTSASGQDWERWFGFSRQVFRNPLGEAEAWAKGAAEREVLIDANNGRLTLDGTHTNMVAETPLATSPPFNQRLMDQQAAMSGIYPTPPDGLVPGHLPQQPTSDGPAAAMQAEHSTLSNDLQAPSSDDNPLVATSSMESNGEAQPYQMNSDDLFGDMGEMDFGANEVGDADFDYFDEPDELPEAEPLDHDVDMAEDETSPEENHHTKANAHENVVSDTDNMTADEPAILDSRPTSSHDQPERQTTEVGQDEVMEGADASPQISPTPQTVIEPEKSLSPWSIRRQLVPMIPASARSADTSQAQSNRRSSTFEPMAFNENLDLVSKYAINKRVDFAQDHGLAKSLTVDVPPKKSMHSMPNQDPDSGVTDLDSTSDDEADDSSADVSEAEALPPRLPWETKKRKRSSWQEQYTPLTSTGENPWPMEDKLHIEDTDFDLNKMTDVLEKLFRDRTNTTAEKPGYLSKSTAKSLIDTITNVEDLLELDKIDLVYVAQIMTEQAVSSIPGILESMKDLALAEDYNAISTALRNVVEMTTEKLLHSMDDCNIAKLALMKEPPQRPMINPGKAPQTGQPRPPQREGSMQLGPDYFPLPPPYFRFQRGTDTYEMLPPVVSFWSAVGLGPVNGQKEVTPIALVPGAPDLLGSVQDFMRDLGGIYESRKLGSFSRTSEMQDALAEAFDDGCFPVKIGEEHLSLEGALHTFASACEDVGQTLAGIGHTDPDRTIAVLIIDPFEDERLRPYLVAAFWKLCKAYRQHIPKAHAKAPRSDLVLQLIPVSLIAAPDRLVVLDAQHLGSLAMEIYDRCPPSSKALAAMDAPSALPILAAPSVELAPARIHKPVFVLNADPPSDLMHEGSILHIAYALSADRQWMAVNWTDLTGKYQSSMAASLRGRTFKDAAVEVWERTRDILAARDVTWRIFMVTNVDLDPSEAKCWRGIVTSKFRRQVLHVTFLSVQLDTSLQLTAPSADGANAANGSGQAGAFLTPGSTPQATMTVSPDASGQTAPPTPAPTESTPNNAENDPDATLVDVTDESWGMLLSPSFAPTTSQSIGPSASKAPAIARGILFRRGEAITNGSSDKLESLGVNLHWDIRMRYPHAIDEGPPRQGEATLREVLRMYRNLGLLARARNVSAGSSGDGKGGERLVPVHVAGATRAAEALGWFRIEDSRDDVLKP